MQEFRAGHDPIAMLDEIDEHRENLRLQLDSSPGSPELEPAGIEVAFTESVQHGAMGSPGMSCSLPKTLLDRQMFFMSAPVPPSENRPAYGVRVRLG